MADAWSATAIISETTRIYCHILRGDEMAELPTDAVNSRYRPI
jgi:hypothetical protein